MTDPESSSLLFYRRPGVGLAIASAGAVGTAVLLLSYGGVDAPAWVRQAVDVIIGSGPALIAVTAAVVFAGTPGLVRRVFLRWRWSDAGLGLAVGLLLRAVVEIVAPTTGILGTGFGEASAADYIVLAVGAVLVTPWVEELFFRGLAVAVLLDVFRPLGRVGAAIIAVTVSTAAFALLHLLAVGDHASWMPVVAPLAVGVGCGILFALTGRIAAGVVAHVVFNAIGILLLLT